MSIRIIDREKTNIEQFNQASCSSFWFISLSLVQIEMLIEHGNKFIQIYLKWLLYIAIVLGRFVLISMKLTNSSHFQCTHTIFLKSFEKCNTRSRPIQHWMEKYFFCYGLMSIIKLLLCYPIHFSRKEIANGWFLSLFLSYSRYRSRNPRATFTSIHIRILWATAFSVCSHCVNITIVVGTFVFR